MSDNDHSQAHQQPAHHEARHLSDDDIYHVLTTALQERIRFRKESRRLIEELERVNLEKATLAKQKEEAEKHADEFERRFQTMSLKYTEQKAEAEYAQVEYRRVLRKKLGESGLLSRLQELERQNSLLQTNDVGGGTQVSIRTVRSALERWLRGFGGEFADKLMPVVPSDGEVIIGKDHIPPGIDFQHGAPWSENVTRVRCRVVATGWKVRDEIIERAVLDVIAPVMEALPELALQQQESARPTDSSPAIEPPLLHVEPSEPGKEVTIISDQPCNSQDNLVTAEPVHLLASDSHSADDGDVRRSGDMLIGAKKRIPSPQEVEAMIHRADEMYGHGHGKIRMAERIGITALLSSLHNGVPNLSSALNSDVAGGPERQQITRRTKKLISDPELTSKYLEIVGSDNSVQAFVSEFLQAVISNPDMSIPEWIKHNS